MSIRKLLRLIRARLSQRIAFWVLVSILLIEAIIVIPSYIVRKDQLLAQLEELGLSTVLAIVNLEGVEADTTNLVFSAPKLARGTVVKGGAIYQHDGTRVGTFGELPTLTFDDVQSHTVVHALSDDRLRYDVAWSTSVLNAKYHVIARLDSTDVKEELDAYTWRMVFFILIITAFVTTAAMLAVSITVITPVLRLRDHLLATGEGQSYDSTCNLSIDRKDELGDVMSAFNTMSHKIKERTSALEATANDLTQANEQLQTLNDQLQNEIIMAQRIQQSLLPPAEPNWKGPNIRCYSIPASAVGGDFYVYHNLTDGVYGIAVGDVSGKGMPAALLMAVSVASFHSIAKDGLAPKELLAHLDQAITPFTHTTHQNCAMVYAMIQQLTPDTCVQQDTEYVLRVANAGCIAPIIRHVHGGAEWIDVGGLPLGTGLGLDGKNTYNEVCLSLAQGDIVLLMSDGVVEANNPDGAMFSFERLEQAVIDGPTTSAEDMLAHLKACIQTFVGNNEAHDDITIVVIQV